ncbi:MAG: flagellar motor protein MotB [Candidatus Eremiobacteraeota bacterium]|nr:flagellar motor protein MotB [Candidatus Eremiobacteraeota bacterium]
MPQAIKSAARASESRMRKRGAEQKMETAGMMRWLLTYADMITLLLALFIILFSISTINKVKFQALVHEMGGGFDNDWAVNQPPNGGTNGNQSLNASSNIPAIQKQLEKYIQQNHLEKSVQTRLDRRGLVITLLSDKSYYDSGSAELRPETKVILDRINRFIQKNNYMIRVEGNTDDVPIATGLYPTNWELSTARATNVVRYLVEKDGLSPSRISAAGYGQYKPRTQNSSDTTRQQNRRVDIVILNATFSKLEKGQ